MRHEQLYTFALEYPLHGEVFYEEIDVRATSHAEAVDMVREEADRDYMPGWTRIVELPPGGSGGLVQVFSA